MREFYDFTILLGILKELSTLLRLLVFDNYDGSSYYVGRVEDRRERMRW